MLTDWFCKTSLSLSIQWTPGCRVIFNENSQQEAAYTFVVSHIPTYVIRTRWSETNQGVIRVEAQDLAIYSIPEYTAEIVSTVCGRGLEIL